MNILRRSLARGLLRASAGRRADIRDPRNHPEGKPKVRYARPPLELHGVELLIDGRTIVGPLSVSVSSAHVTTLMGPSGSGKSSLLAFISGTLSPVFVARGRVCLGGWDMTGLPPERRRVGILFQDDLLFPHLSVSENLAFGLPPRLSRQERRRRVDEMLAEAGLADFADRDPATLSGGQRARVALLRTLLAEPRALLLDEPFSKLDTVLRNRFRRFVFEHARARSLPTLLVTHDPADAEAAQGRVIHLDQSGYEEHSQPVRATG